MAPKASKTASAQPHGYEFGGPLGAAAITFGLPLLTYGFIFGCNSISGCPAPSLLSPKSLDLEVLKREVGWPEDGFAGLYSNGAMGYVLGYYLLNLFLHAVMPASVVEGTELASGGRLKYRLNGMSTMFVRQRNGTLLTTAAFSSHMLLLAVAAAGTALHGADFPLWTYISENYLQLYTANLLISFAIATFVYVNSFSVLPGNPTKRELAAGGHTGNMMYDWFIGRELNPRVTLPLLGELDIKVWCELRPGILGWLLLDLAWAAQQWRNYGYITDSMAFVVGIQGLYCIDSWWSEESVLTMMDITMDGFGFMLAFGDLAWVPFIYANQARYLSVHPQTLGPYGIAAMLAILGVGFTIFRLSNNQKNAFRRDPKDPAVSHLEYIETKTGSKLLVSGWWGVSRHVNYFGDWMQTWPYCLP
ncbi:DUF1295 domain-containing protein, partial [Candidatus Bathyarchaeota archaeon]|nr:DUF1295 domain-containing protein [Candidatus Bathyarchaeota archaeon]